MDKTSILELTPPFYTVYRVTNLVNGKIYVGKHKTNDLQDNYLGSGKMLRRAITKYGRESFVKEILFVFPAEDEMNEKEKELVTEEFCARSDTYNICTGGQGGFGWINKNGLAHQFTEEERKRIADKQRGRRNPRTSEILKERHANGLVRYDRFAGKTHSGEARQKIREAGRLRTGSRNSQYGTRWMTKDGCDVKVTAERVEEMLLLGYVFGKTRKRTACAHCCSHYDKNSYTQKYCSPECRISSRNPLGLSKKELNTLSKRRSRAREKVFIDP